VALEKIDGVETAFVQEKLELLLSKEVDVDEEHLNKVLKDYKIKVSKIETAQSFVF